MGLAKPDLYEDTTAAEDQLMAGRSKGETSRFKRAALIPVGKRECRKLNLGYCLLAPAP